MAAIHRESWSPYAVGTAIGILNTFAMATAKRPLGITTSFEKSAALAGEAAAPAAAQMERYQRQRDISLKIDWEAALVVGVLLGSLTSARLSEGSHPKTLPNQPERTRLP